MICPDVTTGGGVVVGGELVTVKGAVVDSDSAVHDIVPEPAATPVTVGKLTVAALVLVDVHEGVMQARWLESLRVVTQTRDAVPGNVMLIGFGVIAMETGVATAPVTSKGPASSGFNALSTRALRAIGVPVVGSFAPFIVGGAKKIGTTLAG